MNSLAKCVKYKDRVGDDTQAKIDVEKGESEAFSKVDDERKKIAEYSETKINKCRYTLVKAVMISLRLTSDTNLRCQEVLCCQEN